MKNYKTIRYNGRKYSYRIDEHRTLWIRDSPNSEFNMGQVRPIVAADNIEEVVLEMLKGAGY